jgi:hypothetical protein
LSTLPHGPTVISGAPSSLVRQVESSVIITGDTHEELWVHPNLVTVPGDPVSIELAFRSTDRRGGDRHTTFNYLRTDDDFRSLGRVETPVSTDWRLIGLTPRDFDPPEDAAAALPDGEWHWARNSVHLDAETVLYPFLTREGECRSVRTVGARLRGDRLVPVYVSNALGNGVARGLLEPQIAEHSGRHYLTMRAEDGFGYVSVSGNAGRSWSPPRAWRWDDGQPIPMHSTMTKLLSHADGLLLVYTRIRDDNQAVMRSRSPLHCADLDPETLSLRRSTERVIVPNRGLPVGNFWVWPIDQTRSYVTVAEWPRDGREQNGDVWLARIHWRSPNLQMLPDGRERAALPQPDR